MLENRCPVHLEIASQPVVAKALPSDQSSHDVETTVPSTRIEHPLSLTTIEQIHSFCERRVG